jgi:hypothetical protein
MDARGVWRWPSKHQPSDVRRPWRKQLRRTPFSQAIADKEIKQASEQNVRGKEMFQFSYPLLPRAIIMKVKHKTVVLRSAHHTSRRLG